MISRGRGEFSAKSHRRKRRLIVIDIGGLADLLPRISDYDEKNVHRRLLQKRLVGTTQWFLDHPNFKAWFTDRTISSLWCSGKSKCSGKV